MQGYNDVSVVWDGALDQSDNLTDGELDALVEEIDSIVASRPVTVPVELYSIWHDHSPEVECECAQYVTDGRPLYGWNTDYAQNVRT